MSAVGAPKLWFVRYRTASVLTCFAEAVMLGSKGDTVVARHIDDTRHWRVRAEEAYRLASQMADPEGKRLMLGIAVSYLQLAANAEQRSAARQRSRDYRK